jgi:hypothetical protein
MEEEEKPPAYTWQQSEDDIKVTVEVIPIILITYLIYILVKITSNEWSLTSNK